MNTIQIQMSKFRNLLNDSLLKYKLLNATNNWYQICSSMDCLEDTQLVINYFVKSDFPKAEGKDFLFNYGGQYIYVYGLFQALFLQQDA